MGMAAFLSGSGRITLMLATVIIELTDDASLIGPVGVASIIAMIVGNMFNHGLYHGKPARSFAWYGTVFSAADDTN